MKILLVVSAVLLLSSSNVFADTACEALSTEIQRLLKVATLESAEEIGDTSAVRATVHQQKIANQLSLIAINLTLMSATKCPLPAKPMNLGI